MVTARRLVIPGQAAIQYPAECAIIRLGRHGVLDPGLAALRQTGMTNHGSAWEPVLTTAKSESQASLRFAWNEKGRPLFPFLTSVIPWLDHGIHADTPQIGKALP
jgi:hypothetical protein